MKIKEYIFLALLLMSMSVFGSDCIPLYPHSTPIEVVGSGEVCKSFFVVVYDRASGRALFSVEKVATLQVSTHRTGSFYNSPVGKLDTNNYPVGYDRGHLTPAADADSAEQMHETFDLINSAPQVPKLNRGQWAQLEKELRARPQAPEWILTGVIYNNDSMIPFKFYKVAYFKGKTEAFVALNDPSGSVEPISVSALQNIAKVNF